MLNGSTNYFRHVFVEGMTVWRSRNSNSGGDGGAMMRWLLHDQGCMTTTESQRRHGDGSMTTAACPCFLQNLSAPWRPETLTICYKIMHTPHAVGVCLRGAVVSQQDETVHLDKRGATHFCNECAQEAEKCDTVPPPTTVSKPSDVAKLSHDSLCILRSETNMPCNFSV